MNSASRAAAAAAIPLIVLAAYHPMAAVAAAPAVAMAVALLATLLPGHPWRGATPVVAWLTAGRPAACRAALLAPAAAGALVALPTLLLALPPTALPGGLLYLATAVLLTAGVALHAPTGMAACARTAAVALLLYGVPLYLLAIAELFPHPEQAIAVALPFWPPALAASLTGVDLARLPWAYANLPLAYYPYRYPSPPLATLGLLLPAAALHLTLWRRPHRGWRPSPWS